MASTRTDAVNGRVATHVLQARTDSAGTAQTDIDGQDLRVANDAFTAGVGNRATGFQVLAQSPAAMAVDVGSGTVGDVALVAGTEEQQGNYRVSWPDATTEVTIPAADLVDDRIDEIYLVVEDDQFDLSGRTLPALFHRDGTPAGTPSAPGPDAAWTAFILLAEVLVPAAATEITDTEITDRRVRSGLTLSGARRLWVATGDENRTRVDAPTASGIIDFLIGGGVVAFFDANGLDLQANDITDVGNVSAVTMDATGPGGITTTTLTGTGLISTSAGITSGAQINAGGNLDMNANNIVDVGTVDGAPTGITTRAATSNADVSMTTSFQDIASFTFNKPAGWGTYEALVTGQIGGSATSVRVRLGGNNGSSSDISAAGARFTGISGSSNVVAVQALHSGGTGTVTGGVVSATFIRTS